MTQVVVCQVDDLSSGEARRFDIEGHRIAVVRIGEMFHAIGDRCSHANFSLSEGEVFTDECQIECFKHGSRFSLLTGEPDFFPATQPVPVYEVEIDGSEVRVTLE